MEIIAIIKVGNFMDLNETIPKECNGKSDII